MFQMNNKTSLQDYLRNNKKSGSNLRGSFMQKEAFSENDLIEINQQLNPLDVSISQENPSNAFVDGFLKLMELNFDSNNKRN